MTKDELATARRVRCDYDDEDDWWSIASPIDREVITLSGPGPCRSVRYVNVRELLLEWSPVP